LRPIDGALRAAQMLRRRWQEVWPFLSTQPAHFMRFKPALIVGASADFCLVRENRDGELQAVRTFVQGREVESEPAGARD
jgi:dihydroorotase-like cyclic amidohydrolase